MIAHLTGVDRDYALRSLRHEIKMLAAYRHNGANSPTLRRARVNACCRVAAFEWALSQEPEIVVPLWREAAQVLAAAASIITPDQLLLGLHLALVTRDVEAFRGLVAAAAHSSVHRAANPAGRLITRQHLVEGYGLLGLALLEQRLEPARAALQALQAALATNDRASWQKHAPNLLAAHWLMAEHRAVCMLLKAVAEIIVQREPRMLTSTLLLLPEPFAAASTSPPFAAQFALAMDDALLRLEKYVTVAAAHHPQLYLWIPGLALCHFARSAQRPLEWLPQRFAQQQPGYARLPQAFLDL